MRTTKVIWNNNAKAAVKAYDDWAGEESSMYVSYIDEFMQGIKQTKTVADAVEYYNGEFPEGQAILGIAYSNNKITPYYAGSPIADGTNSSESYIICTREQFESYVKQQEAKKKYPPITQSLIDEAEQEDEEWTHEYHGDNCKIVHQEKWQAWIISENGLSKLVPISELRKPKPTISEDAKRQLELYVQYRVDKYGNYDMKSDLSDYLSHHDII